MENAPRNSDFSESLWFGQGEGNQYVIFQVSSGFYAIPIERVREIVAYQRVTPLPNAEGNLLGMMNLRGTIIPIFDPRRYFGLETPAPTPFHVVIILEFSGKLIGVLADAVLSIDAVQDTQITPPERMQSAPSFPYLNGLFDWQGSLVCVLATEKMFAEELEIATDDVR